MANQDNNVEMQIAEIDGDEKEIKRIEDKEFVPSYKVYEDSRIPVSKATGTMWKTRLDEIKNIRKKSGDEDRWSEAIRYYQNDQAVRGSKKLLQGVAKGAEGANGYSTENIVFANTSALVPAMYAKNPDVSLTTTISEQEPKTRLFQKVLNKVIKGKQTPCLNIKPKMKQLVVLANLTNIAYLYLSFTEKELASETAVADIEKLSEEYKNAKTPADIEEIEGKLASLEERVNLLGEGGFKIKTVSPFNVFVDPAATQADLSDARFVIVYEDVSTSMIEAVYGEKDVDGKYKSIYKPTHVLSKSNKKSDSEEHENTKDFDLFAPDTEHDKYGYGADEVEDFKSNRRTRVAMVWDKLTRRVLMYNNSDWSWPIWVWDDPLGISRFFPVFPITFVTDPVKSIGASEVVYYLDQQDEINRINNERARMREWASSKIFVNTAVAENPDEIMNFLNNKTDKLVHGIDIPEGKSIQDVIGSFAAPSTQFEQLFNTQPIIESINRLSAVSPVLRNVEFKTNTTNKAIDSYQSSSQMRLDEKIDALEEFIGDVAYAVLEIILQKFDEGDVVKLVGSQAVTDGGGWQQMEPEDVANTFSISCVGGSTLKPTSAVKKDQAMNLMQILGQYAGASPMVVLMMLKVVERAFKDDYVVEDQDWQSVIQGIEQQIMGQQQPQQPNQGGQPEENNAQSMEQVAAQVAEIVDNLPPEAKQFLAENIIKGVPLQEILGTLIQQMQPQQ